MILKIDETVYGYRKAVVGLYITEVKVIEDFKRQINKHVQGEGIPPIKLVYDNRVYPKNEIVNPTMIKVRGVWLTMETNLFPRFG